LELAKVLFAHTHPQLQGSGLGEWFAFDPHFYVMDCRLSRDSETDRLRVALVAYHTALAAGSAQVPTICATLLEHLAELRKRHAKEPIVTVEVLLRSAVEIPESLAPVSDSICR
jgi:hypothetical protein